MFIKFPSKFPSLYFTTAICFATVFLLLAQEISACSWDYPIWQIRSKNADPLYRFIKGDKAGYIDQTGKIVIEPSLDYYGNHGGEFFNGLLLTGVGDGAYIDKNGKIVLDTKYDRNWDFSEGLAVAMKESNSKWGYIDKSGKFVISPRFETYPNGYVYSFSEGLAMIKVKKKYGYIDRTGEFVIMPKLLKGSDFQEGLARVVIEGPCSYVGDGPCAIFNAETLGEKVEGQKIPACKFTFIDKTGLLISEKRFERAKGFSEDLAPVMVGEKWGFIDRQGKIVIQAQFDVAEPFSDGLAAIKQGKLWGFINKKGEIVIPAQFDDVEKFSDELAPVGKWNQQEREYTDYYYINKLGKQAFPGNFEKASFYFKGVAHVKLIEKNKPEDDYYLNGKYAYLDVNGRKILTYERNYKDD